MTDAEWRTVLGRHFWRWDANGRFNGSGADAKPVMKVRVREEAHLTARV